jgi:hypothetical protein
MSAASAALRVATAVKFRRGALDDIVRYEAWRVRRNPSWRPIGNDLVEAIERTVSSYPSFEAVPAPLLAVRGQVALLKRLLIPVRSKVFRVYVGPGRQQGEISVRRIRHPSLKSIEGE